MKRLLILLILSFFSLQSYAGSCPDGSDPVKSISADGTYFVYNCGGSSNNDTSLSTNSSSTTSTVSNKNNSKGIDRFGGDSEIPEEANPNDEIIEDKGVKVLIDPKAVMYLLGTEMDYKREELSSTFVFKNPNETERCGCGESFKI